MKKIIFGMILGMISVFLLVPGTAQAAACKAVFSIHIPKLNKHLVVNNNTSLTCIAKPRAGHYVDSQMPTQNGNVAVAGHRVSSVFLDIDKLKTGDQIYIDYGGKRYFYSVYRRVIVSPTAWWVIEPQPGYSRVVTLTSCLRSGSQQREVVFAKFVRVAG